MPGRRLRDLTADRVIRGFERAGYRIVRVHGSHVILTREGSATISIPRHATVKIGLLLAKIKVAGMTPDEFEELL
jgi:predicted RNA binding protein YcfA (HicA-like mRNA interferase family)